MQSSSFFATMIDAVQSPSSTGLTWCNDTAHKVMAAVASDDGKSVQVRINVEDPGTFNMAWSARQNYKRNEEKRIEETICAENNEVIFDAAVSPIPKADQPDF